MAQSPSMCLRKWEWLQLWLALWASAFKDTARHSQSVASVTGVWDAGVGQCVLALGLVLPGVCSRPCAHCRVLGMDNSLGPTADGVLLLSFRRCKAP